VTPRLGWFNDENREAVDTIAAEAHQSTLA
jgi:hypothetical protein